MTELEPRYRFTKDFEFFDYDGSRLYRTWRAGTVVIEPKGRKTALSHRPCAPPRCHRPSAASAERYARD
jgi:hypothetical protein